MGGPITSYGHWGACSPVNKKTGNPLGIAIPAKAYRAKYFVSRAQLLRLVRRRAVMQIRYKRQIFIYDQPPPIDCPLV